MQAYKNLKINVASLYLLRILSQLLTFVTIPLIISQLGIDEYGKYAYSIGILGYILLLIDYGFDYTGIREIGRGGELSLVIMKVYFAKIFLALIGSALVIIISISIDIDSRLFYACFFLIVTQAFFPTFIFQAKKDMAQLLKISIASKIVSFVVAYIAIILFSSIWMLPLIYGLVNLVVLYILFFFIKERYKLKNVKIRVKDITSTLIGSFDIFITKFSTGLFTGLPILVVGSLYSKEIVGIFSLFDKIVLGLKGLFLPLIQGLFPYASNLLKYKSADLKKLYALASIICLFFLAIAICIVLMLQLNLSSIGLSSIEKYTHIFKYIVAIAFFSLVNNIFVNIFLINFDQENKIKYFNLVVTVLCSFILLSGYTEKNWENIFSVILLYEFFLALFSVSLTFNYTFFKNKRNPK